MTFFSKLSSLNPFSSPATRRKPITRYRFFLIMTLINFMFFFLPGFIFTALSVFSFVCWAAPDSIVINQLFGVWSGLGMSVLTADWTQVKVFDRVTEQLADAFLDILDRITPYGPLVGPSSHIWRLRGVFLGVDPDTVLYQCEFPFPWFRCSGFEGEHRLGVRGVVGVGGFATRSML
jgi:hypothetical protein